MAKSISLYSYALYQVAMVISLEASETSKLNIIEKPDLFKIRGLPSDNPII
jgi:hypothetical protein